MLSTLFSGWLTMLEFAAAPQLLPSEGLVILRGQEISEERARAVGKDRAFRPRQRDVWDGHMYG